MASLSRRQNDGGFYIRTGRGYFGTKQVHPDAVRLLNQRNVYVGDEIPSHLMSTIAARAGWLFTKEEHPNVTFWEMSDPDFGTRPEARSAVQGTTRVFSYSATGPNPKRRSAPSGGKSAAGMPASAIAKPAPRTGKSKSSGTLPVATSQIHNPGVATQKAFDTPLMASSASSSRASLPEVDAAGPDNRLGDDWFQKWIRRGAYLPLWAIILILVLILVIALLVSML